MRYKRRFAAVVIAGCVALPLAACGEDGGTKPSELTAPSSTIASSTGPASSEPPAEDDEAAVIAAYKGWFEAINGMGLATDEQVAAALSPYGTDSIVQQTVEVFAKKRAEGLIPGGAVVFGALDVTVQASEATVLECRDTSTETSIDITSGNVVGSGAPATRLEAHLVSETDGAWRIAEYSALEGEC